MSNFLLGLAATLIGPIAGLLTNRIMNYVDDVAKLTANLPDAVKQLIVMVLAAVIPVLNAKFGLQLPSDIAGILSQPTVQSVVAFVLALILKGHQKQAVITTQLAALKR